MNGLLFFSLNVLNAWNRRLPADYINLIIRVTITYEMAAFSHGLD